MTNVTPLGSGARSNYIPPASTDPTAIPLAPPVAGSTPTQPAADASDPSAPAVPSAPAADSTTTPSPAPAAASVEPPFDATEFYTAFAALKQAVTDQRAAYTQDVAALQAEDQQLEASIADWDARAAAAERRRQAIAADLDGKLTVFGELDQATAHLEATEALLYPQPAATPAPADAPTQ